MWTTSPSGPSGEGEREKTLNLNAAENMPTAANLFLGGGYVRSNRLVVTWPPIADRRRAQLLINRVCFVKSKNPRATWRDPVSVRRTFSPPPNFDVSANVHGR